MKELYKRPAAMEELFPSEKQQVRRKTGNAVTGLNIEETTLKDFLVKLQAHVANEEGSIRGTYTDEAGKTQRKYHNIKELVNEVVNASEKGELVGDKLVSSSKLVKTVLDSLEKSIQSAQVSLSEKKAKAFSPELIEASKVLNAQEDALKPLLASFRKLSYDDVLPLGAKPVATQTQTGGVEVMQAPNNIAASK